MPTKNSIAQTEKPKTRSISGSIFKRVVTKFGRKMTVYDARKRYFDPAAGKYKDKTVRCSSKSEAVAALNNLHVEILERLDNDNNLTRDATMYQLIEYFETEYVKPAVYIGARKIGGYRQDLSTVRYILGVIKDFFANVRLRKITYERVRAFAEKLAQTKDKRGKTPTASTIHKKLSILRRMFTVAVQLGWLDVNPFARGASLISKAAENERHRILTFDEENRLLAELIDGTRPHTYERGGTTVHATKRVYRAYLLPFVLLSLDTAMRRGEIYKLQWWQVDLDDLVIYLTEDAAKKTKTGEEGVLPMTARLFQMLHDVKKNSPQTKKNDLVLGEIDFKRAFANACADAKIEDLQFRDLRATGATRMLMAGVSDALARKVTRHTREETLRKHYTRIDVVNAQSIGAKLDIFIEGEFAKIEAKKDSTG